MGRRRSVAAVAFVGLLLALLPAPAEMAQPLLAEVALGGTAFLLLPGRLFEESGSGGRPCRSRRCRRWSGSSPS